MATITGKSKGLAVGDFVYLRSSGWIGRIISDVNTFAPVCYVWGDYPEAGSCYASDMTKVSESRALSIAQMSGHDNLVMPDYFEKDLQKKLKAKAKKDALKASVPS
jgi:hypothetical protein